MIDFDMQISHLEERLENGRIKTAAILALRYWQASRLCPDPSRARNYIQRAYHAALTTHRRNPSQMYIYTLTIFIAIESGHFDSANELLDQAMGYKAFLRANAPTHFATLNFLYAYLEINQGRNRSARKYWRALTSHGKNAPTSEYMTMEGLLYLASGQFSDATRFFSDALDRGNNSVFLFMGLYELFNKANNSESSAILSVLIYAAKRGVDISGISGISGIAISHSQALSSAVALSPALGEKLYEKSGYAPILQEICSQRIAAGDLTTAAFALYKEAERNQVFVDGLFYYLVHGAYANNGDVSPYAIQEYLKTEKPEADIAVFVYHLALTTPQSLTHELIQQHKNRILELAKECVENGVTGRAANSLFYFAYQNGIYNEAIEKILEEELTLFEADIPANSDIRHIYFTQPETRGMTMRNVVEDEPVVIEASSINLTYTCLGSGRRTIYDHGLLLNRRVPGAGVDLYRYFWEKGDRRPHVLIYLANSSEADAEMLESLLQEKSLTRAYRAKLLVMLGRLYYAKQDFPQALKYYEQVSDAAFDADLACQLLQVYMEMGKHDHAIKLLSKWHFVIPKNALYTAICTLCQADYSNCAPLAFAAYRLLVDGLYNQELLELVLSHHSASYSELTELAQVLQSAGITSRILDKLIVETAVWLAKWDQCGQRAFVRLFPYECDMAFVEYAKYELLANDQRPEPDTLHILEEIYYKTHDSILCISLANCYLRHNFSTVNSENILTNAVETLEADGLLLPVFKENRFARIPFVEKMQPLVYRGQPDKEYYLNYSIDHDPTYEKIPMRHLQYGLFIACVPLFYGEEVSYFFSEEMDTGSVATQTETYKNTVPYLHENTTEDQFFAINNAITYEQMFKHEQVEKIVVKLVREEQEVMAKLL